MGVIHEGLLVAEQFLKPEMAQPITVSHRIGGTLHVPWVTGIDDLPLFVHKNGKWHLRIGPRLKGMVVRDGKTLDVEQVRSNAHAKAKSPAESQNDIVIPLDENANGRLLIWETRILFQFTHEPPHVPPVPLGSRIQTALHRYDWVWLNFLLLMGVIQGLGMVVLQMGYHPREGDMGALSIPNVKMVIAEKKPEPEKNLEQDKSKAADAEKPKEEEEKPKDSDKPKDAPKDTPPLDAAARKAQVQAKVAKQTIIRYLAAVNGGDNNNIVSSDQVGARMAEAWDGTPGVIGDAGETHSGSRYTKEGATGRVAGLSDAEMGETKAGAVETGTVKEAKVKGHISAEAADEVFGSGAMDKGAISQVVQRRLGAIKSCYERELKANPTLAGKVVVQFTIEESGRVGEVKIVTDTTGEPNVGRCIAGQITHFKFPAPTGGSVTASYPFVLQPGT